jgi:probable rRNA maturation factor
VSSEGFLLTVSGRVGQAHVPFLRRQLRRARSLLRHPLRELSVVLVNDRDMSALHQRFLGIDAPTDVLTFPMDQDKRGRAVAGEVLVCVPEARRQALARGARTEHELLLYALHGMLHLCGFDDRTARGFRIMHRTEDRILSRLGVGPVFRSARSSRGSV